MIVTNKRGLPEPVLRALAYDAYRRVGDITMTELLKPPQMLVASHISRRLIT